MQLPPERQMHHFSYARTDEEMLKKITTCDFSRSMRSNWYDDVWLKWTPEMENLGVINPLQIPKVNKTMYMQKEILERLHNKYNA